MLFGELMKYLRILQIFFNFIFKAMRICSYFDLYLRYNSLISLNKIIKSDKDYTYIYTIIISLLLSI